MSKTSAVGGPTRPTQPSIHTGSLMSSNQLQLVDSMNYESCLWLYGCRPKSIGAGLDCGLGCTPALSLTRRADAVALCSLWRYISVMPLPLLCFLPPNSASHNWHLHLEIDLKKITVSAPQFGGMESQSRGDMEWTCRSANAISLRRCVCVCVCGTNC